MPALIAHFFGGPLDGGRQWVPDVEGVPPVTYEWRVARPGPVHVYVQRRTARANHVRWEYHLQGER